MRKLFELFFRNLSVKPQAHSPIAKSYGYRLTRAKVFIPFNLLHRRQPSAPFWQIKYQPFISIAFAKCIINQETRFEAFGPIQDIHVAKLKKRHPGILIAEDRFY